MNQLRMLEDATVIYRLARAPERRIFYIDVGNLPKAKAEQSKINQINFSVKSTTILFKSEERRFKSIHS